MNDERCGQIGLVNDLVVYIDTKGLHVINEIIDEPH